MTEGPYFLEPGSIRADWRLGVGALFERDTGLRVRSGVLHGLGVTQTTTASGSVVVGAGRCVIQDTSATGGAYLETLRADKTVDVLGANPAESSPRNDLIVYEAAAATRVRVIKGAPGAVPADPAVPVQAIRLTRVRVKSAAQYGANAVITNADLDDLAVPTGLVTERRQRVWEFPRQSGLVEDSWTSTGFVTVANGTITDAPAGDYTITYNTVVSNTAIVVGAMRVDAEGKTRSIRQDLSTVPILRAATMTLEHAGGDLDVAVAHSAVSGTSFVQREGTCIVVTYLGPR